MGFKSFIGNGLLSIDKLSGRKRLVEMYSGAISGLGVGSRVQVLASQLPWGRGLCFFFPEIPAPNTLE